MIGEWRRWVIAVVAALVAAACGGGLAEESDAGAPTAPGNTPRFCALWPDARTSLLETVNGDGSFALLGDEWGLLAELMPSRDAALADADAAAPVAVRAEWNVAYGAYTATSDLLYTTGYTNAVLRPAHFAMAYGEAGYDRTVAATEAAVAAIDDWAIEACGDFCVRWPEFEFVLRYEQHFDWGIWEQNLDRYELALAAGDRLVPDDVRAEWDVAVDIQRRRMAMFVESDLRLDVDEATALARWGVLPWDEAKEMSDAALDTVAAWSDAHCEAAVVTIGAPGTVSVRYPPDPELIGYILTAVVLPAGVDFGEVRSVEDYLAVSCSDVGGIPPDARPEDMPTETLSPIEGQGEYLAANLCNLVQREERAVIPGGAHELFVGAFRGGPGAYGLYFAAPDLCIQIPIGVNGPTVVDVPSLESCTLDPVGSPDEVARRTTPPADADGSLRIDVPTLVGRSGYEFCSLHAYLLPAGTTLNAIGRGDAWPAGTVNIHRSPWEEGSGEERRLADRPGAVPLLAMSPSGTGEVTLFPMIHPGFEWDDGLPDPVPVANGSYDLWFYEWCAEEGAESEDYWCAKVPVDVFGDTTVPLPELGECP